MFGTQNLPRVVRVRSSVAVTDQLEAFDMMSRFLAAEKAKQLSHDFEGQAFLASSSQTWNDLRLACNSLLGHNDPRRELVAAWKEQVGESSLPSSPSIKEESSPAKEIKSESKEKSESLKSAKKSAKKAKKEAKKMKKAAKKAKKEKKRKIKNQE